MTKRVLIFAITFVLAAITLPSSAANNVMYVNYAQNSKFDLSEVGSLRSIIADLAPAIPALTDQNATSQINSIPITASLPESCSGQSQYLTDLQAVIRGYSAEKLSIGFLQTNKNLPQAFDVTLVDESNCKKIDFFTIKKQLIIGFKYVSKELHLWKS